MYLCEFFIMRYLSINLGIDIDNKVDQQITEISLQRERIISTYLCYKMWEYIAIIYRKYELEMYAFFS